MEIWSPAVEPSKLETRLLKRLQRSRKLFAFLRRHRHALLSEDFQNELWAMYRRTGAGSVPNHPAYMCLAVLLQGYLGISDAEAVEMTIVDLRWQMVLDCLHGEEPLFSQGALQGFRERLIAHRMDVRLLERTLELAEETGAFDVKKLRKNLRIAVDARPFEGAGRVEDTLNMLGHAARKMVQLTAQALDVTIEEVCRRAETPLFQGSSLKAAIDIDWQDIQAREHALDEVARQVFGLFSWLEKQVTVHEGKLCFYMRAAAEVWSQNLEVGSHGLIQLKQGTSPERRISIEDPDMRHGRKSRNKTVRGHKEHIGLDLDSGLILATEVTPANRPEGETATPLLESLSAQGRTIAELYVDRAYTGGALAIHTLENGGEIQAKPRSLPTSNYFPKTLFDIDVEAGKVTCPSGVTAAISPKHQTVHFSEPHCRTCKLRSKCTPSKTGRTLHIAADEELQQQLRVLQSTAKGRRQIRQRVPVEHALARIAGRKGPRARYRGLKKNNFDTRRAATIYNLEKSQGTTLLTPKHVHQDGEFLCNYNVLQADWRSRGYRLAAPQ